MRRRMNSIIDLQDTACMRRDLKEAMEGTQEQNKESQGTAKANAGAGNKPKG